MIVHAVKIIMTKVTETLKAKQYIVGGDMHVFMYMIIYTYPAWIRTWLWQCQCLRKHTKQVNTCLMVAHAARIIIAMYMRNLKPERNAICFSCIHVYDENIYVYIHTYIRMYQSGATAAMIETIKLLNL